RARNLNAPLAIDTKDAAFEHSAFWDDNGLLLQDAWAEFEGYMNTCAMSSSSNNDDAFLNPTLATVLDDAIGNPTEETESVVKSLWTSEDLTLPKKVYAAQLLTESGISRIRKVLDAVDPMLELVEGELINRVVRPVGRMLFKDRVGCEDDLEYFAFTIRYDGTDDNGVNNIGTDRDANSLKRDFELKEHRDASVVTLNINLNLPDEGYGGSEVYFREYPSEESTADNIISNEDDSRKDGGTVQFSPGMAIIHLGAHRHGSLPISASTTEKGSGKRYNLVIWLFGKDGDVRISPYEKEEQMNVAQRWHGCSNHTRDFSFEL
ncbi:hypothetical protein ACHAXR_005861, partial [Thalassiosira sp. AJA248-18]